MNHLIFFCEIWVHDARLSFLHTTVGVHSLYHSVHEYHHTVCCKQCVHLNTSPTTSGLTLTPCPIRHMEKDFRSSSNPTMVLEFIELTQSYRLTPHHSSYGVLLPVLPDKLLWLWVTGLWRLQSKSCWILLHNLYAAFWRSWTCFGVYLMFFVCLLECEEGKGGACIIT